MLVICFYIALEMTCRMFKYFPVIHLVCWSCYTVPLVGHVLPCAVLYDAILLALFPAIHLYTLRSFAGSHRSVLLARADYM